MIFNTRHQLFETLPLHWWGNGPQLRLGAGWTPGPVLMQWWREKFLLTLDIEAWLFSLQCVTITNDWAILAPRIYSIPLWKFRCIQICTYDPILDCHYGPHFDTLALSMPQNSSYMTLNKICHTSQFNLLRIGHTFLTQTAHRWAKSKIIKILNSHVPKFSYWLNVGHYDGIYAYLVPFLQETKWFNYYTARCVFICAVYITDMNKNFSSSIYISKQEIFRKKKK